MSYSKTSLGADQVSAIRLSRRGKQILLTVVGALVAAGVGIGVWSATATDSWTGSTSDCVNVTVPGSVGAEVLHNCGPRATSFCRSAYDDTIGGSATLARLARQQCAIAGYTRAKLNAG